jgi:hypothetical protein
VVSFKLSFQSTRFRNSSSLQLSTNPAIAILERERERVCVCVYTMMPASRLDVQQLSFLGTNTLLCPELSGPTPSFHTPKHTKVYKQNLANNSRIWRSQTPAVFRSKPTTTGVSQWDVQNLDTDTMTIKIQNMVCTTQNYWLFYLSP